MKQLIKDRILRIGNAIIFPIIILLLWQILGSLGILYETILPAPIKVVRAFWEMVQEGTLAVDVWVSLKRVLVGSFIGILAALALGFVSGLVPFVERLLQPIVDVVRQISLYAWIPLIVLWLGIGELSKDVIIARGVFIPVYINCVSGIKNIQKEYVELGKVLELNKTTFLRKIVFPSAAPVIFTGLRLAVGDAWTAVVAAEALGGLTGLGYALLNAKEFLKSDRLIAVMFVIAILASASDFLLKQIEKHAFKWKEN